MHMTVKKGKRNIKPQHEAKLLWQVTNNLVMGIGLKEIYNAMFPGLESLGGDCRS